MLKHKFLKEIFRNYSNIIPFKEKKIETLCFDELEKYSALMLLLDPTLFKKAQHVVHKEDGIEYSIILDDEYYDIEIDDNINFFISAVLYGDGQNFENSWSAGISIRFDFNLQLLEFSVHASNCVYLNYFEVKV